MDLQIFTGKKYNMFYATQIMSPLVTYINLLSLIDKDEIREAIESDILYINLESEAEHQ